MKKRFVLATMAVMVVGIGCSGCGLSGAGEVESVVDVGISNKELVDVSEEEILLTENTTGELIPENEESVEDESSAETTESSLVGNESESSEVSESTEVIEEPEVSEEPVVEETTEIASEPTTEASTEEPSEEPTEEVTESTTEEPEEEAFVAYDPNYVVALATEKTKAYGKIFVWENLDRLLVEGKITQEEYDEYYPYDGLEDSYYSVFVETDLNKASTISGSPLVSEEGIADYIAGMLALETGPYFVISYAGIYEGNSGDFYEFRCHR